ncbi:amino acid transporter-like protein [Calycina marina]|uniref:Amino acid transporter-like protein n=1 Tax=Calycina marina TaxID=1763456 RepID=A0A9P7ZBW7_9HELO|nr:amino acid transporter-like protein [Calycina marina]
MGSRMDYSKTFYSASTSTLEPLLTQPPQPRVRDLPKAFHSFLRHSAYNPEDVAIHGRKFDAHQAAFNTANTTLSKKLKGRHLQMLAIGGSIGTGLFIGSGQALGIGGPASLLLAFIIIGIVLYCTVQALGEMAVAFPVAGSFSAFATRFIDPAWGFASGWNYAMQWLFVLPLEIMSAAITLDYWNLGIPTWASIAVFLGIVIAINLGGIRAYSEAEYGLSILKVTAVIGFIILGIVLNIGGDPNGGYIGGRYWQNPGAFRNGFQGFCNLLVTAAFSFSGTELVGLAAAETENPSKSLPKAIKQVFWRIAIFYIASITIIGLLVPYNHPSLVSRDNVASKTSPFIIAIKDAGINGLDSVMNAVILVAVLSVANSSMYGATRTLSAMAEQGQAPQIFGYIDRNGRPLFSICVASAIGLLSFLYLSPVQGPAFAWLLALSGLASIFTWCSICYAHIRFRKAWIYHGNTLNDLVYRSHVGVIGSWVGLISLILILVAQFWVAVSPVGYASVTSLDRVSNFFEAYLAAPIVLLFYAFYKLWYRTDFIKIEDMDVVTGKDAREVNLWRETAREEQEKKRKWRILYETFC